MAETYLDDNKQTSHSIIYLFRVINSKKSIKPIVLDSNWGNVCINAECLKGC